MSEVLGFVFAHRWCHQTTRLPRETGKYVGLALKEEQGMRITKTKVVAAALQELKRDKALGSRLNVTAEAEQRVAAFERKQRTAE